MLTPFFAPSFNSLFVTGIIIIFIVLLLLFNYKQFMRLDYYRKFVVLALLAITFGVHGIVHLGLESVYGFNPYRWVL